MISVGIGVLAATAAFVPPTSVRPTSVAPVHVHARAPVFVRMESEEPAEYTKGISSVLGGSKKTEEVEIDAAANIGSALAFVITLGGLAYGTLNPDAVENIAKSQYKCDPNKIVNGKRVECKQTASGPRAASLAPSSSPFPA